ncbi:hypothetical protein BOTBODRAFT_630524 [Botryobasidium botryosum FD-172 SS1]|uniref:Uncharacterized protein n=1 Tax=Botryobasidium botryosum (strain FD-172 SS1) TaxID=930990 RepID=A0A067MQI5_BOTB1|nr:hypothetical protein BOTBODRAFT_630524 [Botryobasidium botryosum FD-172 SS1]
MDERIVFFVLASICSAVTSVCVNVPVVMNFANSLARVFRKLERLGVLPRNNWSIFGYSMKCASLSIIMSLPYTARQLDFATFFVLPVAIVVAACFAPANNIAAVGHRQGSRESASGCRPHHDAASADTYDGTLEPAWVKVKLVSPGDLFPSFDLEISVGPPGKIHGKPRIRASSSLCTVHQKSEDHVVLRDSTGAGISISFDSLVEIAAPLTTHLASLVFSYENGIEDKKNALVLPSMSAVGSHGNEAHADNNPLALFPDLSTHPSQDTPEIESQVTQATDSSGDDKGDHPEADEDDERRVLEDIVLAHADPTAITILNVVDPAQDVVVAAPEGENITPSHDRTGVEPEGKSISSLHEICQHEAIEDRAQEDVAPNHANMPILATQSTVAPAQDTIAATAIEIRDQDGNTDHGIGLFFPLSSMDPPVAASAVSKTATATPGTKKDLVPKEQEHSVDTEAVTAIIADGDTVNAVDFLRPSPAGAPFNDAFAPPLLGWREVDWILSLEVKDANDLSGQRSASASASGVAMALAPSSHRTRGSDSLPASSIEIKDQECVTNRETPASPSLAMNIPTTGIIPEGVVSLKMKGDILPKDQEDARAHVGVEADAASTADAPQAAERSLAKSSSYDTFDFEAARAILGVVPIVSRDDVEGDPTFTKAHDDDMQVAPAGEASSSGVYTMAEPQNQTIETLLAKSSSYGTSDFEATRVRLGILPVVSGDAVVRDPSFAKDADDMRVAPADDASSSGAHISIEPAHYSIPVPAAPAHIIEPVQAPESPVDTTSTEPKLDPPFVTDSTPHTTPAPAPSSNIPQMIPERSLDLVVEPVHIPKTLVNTFPAKSTLVSPFVADSSAPYATPVPTRIPRMNPERSPDFVDVLTRMAADGGVPGSRWATQAPVGGAKMGNIAPGIRQVRKDRQVQKDMKDEKDKAEKTEKKDKAKANEGGSETSSWAPGGSFRAGNEFLWMPALRQTAAAAAAAHGATDAHRTPQAPPVKNEATWGIGIKGSCWAPRTLKTNVGPAASPSTTTGPSARTPFMQPPAKPHGPLAAPPPAPAPAPIPVPARTQNLRGLYGSPQQFFASNFHGGGASTPHGQHFQMYRDSVRGDRDRF